MPTAPRRRKAVIANLADYEHFLYVGASGENHLLSRSEKRRCHVCALGWHRAGPLWRANREAVKAHWRPRFNFPVLAEHVFDGVPLGEPDPGWEPDSTVRWVHDNIRAALAEVKVRADAEADDDE